MEANEIQPSAGDVWSLEYFLWIVYDDLDAIVSLREWLFTPGPGWDADDLAVLRGEIEHAWIQVAATRNGVIMDLRQQESGLAAVGLTDGQLAMKLRTWRVMRARAVQEFNNSNDPTPRSSSLDESFPNQIPPEVRFPRKVPKWLRIGLRALARMLAEVNAILGSLLKVVDRLEILKEFKETLENLADGIADSLPGEA